MRLSMLSFSPYIIPTSEPIGTVNVIIFALRTLKVIHPLLMTLINHGRMLWHCFLLQVLRKITALPPPTSSKAQGWLQFPLLTALGDN